MKDKKERMSDDGIAPNSKGLKRRDLLLSGTSLVEFPPLQAPGNFNIGEAMKKLTEQPGNN